VTLRTLHVSATGRFAVSLAARRSTELRLAYNGLAGDPVSFQVVPRVSLLMSGGKLRALVAPRLPLQVERLQHAQWKPVGNSTGIFSRQVAPGSYRVSVPAGHGYATAISRAVTVRA
jgi:hypothetical protein